MGPSNIIGAEEQPPEDNFSRKKGLSTTLSDVARPLEATVIQLVIEHNPCVSSWIRQIKYCRVCSAICFVSPVVIDVLFYDVEIRMIHSSASSTSPVCIGKDDHDRRNQEMIP